MHFLAGNDDLNNPNVGQNPEIPGQSGSAPDPAATSSPANKLPAASQSKPQSTLYVGTFQVVAMPYYGDMPNGGQFAPFTVPPSS